MMDWLLDTALNLTVLSLTAAVAGASLMAGYWGVLQLLQGQVTTGPIDLAIAVAMAFGAWALVRNRNDLVDR